MKVSENHRKLSEKKLCGSGQKVSEKSLIKISGLPVKFTLFLCLSVNLW